LSATSIDGPDANVALQSTEMTISQQLMRYVLTGAIAAMLGALGWLT